ncbi:MAG: hypothetical protein RLZZ08_110 [Pseudomonadota bacterium]|jgi:maltose O-acetyltransferase
MKLRQAMLKFASKIYRLPANLNDRIEASRKARRCVLSGSAILYPASRIENNGSRDSIRIGSKSRILGRLFVAGHGGSIAIGEHCFVGEHSHIWSSDRIVIGDRVLISHGVNIHDNISHSLSASERHEHFLAIFERGGHPSSVPNIKSAPITIEADAWIGFGATILKSVTIGEGAIVAAQSLVTKDVAPFAIVAGNPAKVIGSAKP